MHIRDYPAIDAHAHYGVYSGTGLTSKFMSGTADEVVARAKACGVERTIVSPLLGLLPRGQADAVAGNEAGYREIPQHPELLQYVIVNPLQPETYAQARRMLKAKWCVGIKIHPEEHRYRISDHGEELFTFFEEVDAPVMTHSGCPNSMPADFVPFADRHPKVRLLLAHLGNSAGDPQLRPDNHIRAIQSAKHGNLWVDTSSAQSILPGLIEYGVRELGAERLLFGSDTPLYHVAMQRTRINAADISDAEKRLILRENAVKFFRLTGLSGS
jgi:predicted TIM-barrel fold metal-dependent hydrolase